MRRADRLFQLVQLLRGRSLTTAAWLAERLEVSERTVYRDVADLVGSGVPIQGEAGMGYSLLKGFELPPLMFTAEELEALILGARMVSAWGDRSLKNGARDALERIEAILPPALKARSDNTLLYVPDFYLPDDGPPLLGQLREAVHQRRKVRIDYEDKEGKPSQRQLWPLGLFFWGTRWTLLGWCELRDDFRNFVLDRISALTVLDAHFELAPHQTLDTFLASKNVAP